MTGSSNLRVSIGYDCIKLSSILEKNEGPGLSRKMLRLLQYEGYNLIPPLKYLKFEEDLRKSVFKR